MCYNRVGLHDCDAACYASIHRKRCDEFKKYGKCKNPDFNETDESNGGAIRQESFVEELCPKKGHKPRGAAANKTK
ncbi:hypothetical protein KJ359_010084 [Pestalotiopsis sp. 9143b]|nr:hypothetical protein KJ359_010084 [Pestalotiopsis sp. 9143b]